MKASPVRPGDYLELFAEIDLIGALSACPGGDCGASHSSDAVPCYPLKVEIFRPDMAVLEGWPAGEECLSSRGMMINTTVVMPDQIRQPAKARLVPRGILRDQ